MQRCQSDGQGSRLVLHRRRSGAARHNKGRRTGHGRLCDDVCTPMRAGRRAVDRRTGEERPKARSVHDSARRESFVVQETRHIRRRWEDVALRQRSDGQGALQCRASDNGRYEGCWERTRWRWTRSACKNRYPRERGREATDSRGGSRDRGMWARCERWCAGRLFC